ncbi:MAG: DUF481 domain-containing protein [Rickettsiales bacterium]|nr:DUF481 domain-containing protein [Rickettsiales bacterium]
MIHKFLLVTITFLAISSHSFAKLVTEEEEKYKGSFDLGATFAKGNSQEQSIQSNFDFDYHFTKELSNILKARAENKEQNEVRTKEEYFVNNQTRHDIDKKNYKFLELQYVNDRFGGYKYRISETVGLGRKLMDDKKYKISVQSGLGLRQSQLTTGEKRHKPTFVFGSDVDIKINEHVFFEEFLNISADNDATIIRSDANLKILISKKLYFKFGILVERTTNVPQGTKNSDITTALKLGYEF